MKTRVTTLFFLVFLCHNLIAQPFSNVASANGITMGYGNGEWGGGMSFADFNGDGLDDLTFASQLGDPIRFFVNNGNGFSPITAPADCTCQSKQVLWADYDNDGDQDLFVTCYNDQNVLFRNDGNLNMVDVTESAGILQQSDPSYGASWGDYNRDGLLDLYVCNYTFGITSQIDHLYQNNGNGTFKDVTESSGITVPANFSFQSIFFDYNNDLWPDIYVAVDMAFTNILMQNNGNGINFLDVSSSSGAGVVVDAMNAGAGDYNNDGYLDLYITNTAPAPGNVLLSNNGSSSFINSSVTCGVDYLHTSWGANFCDINNDTHLDLYVSSMGPGFTNNALFINNGTCPFTLYDGPYSGDSFTSFANAVGDFNGDGKMDIVVSQSAPENFLLLENNSTTTNNYLKIKLAGLDSNRDGLNSWIEVYKDNNKYSRYTQAGEAFMGQNSSTYHFGMADYSTVDSVVIRWTSGWVDRLENVATNQTLFVSEFSTSGALPVILTSFNAKNVGNKYTELSWSTEAEENSKSFEIERSKDGRSFEKIGTVLAQGNSNNPTSYQFEDNITEYNPLYYYRLKMVDLDGEYKYSNISAVRFFTQNDFAIQNLYPNPAKSGEVWLVVTTSKELPSTISLFDNIGRHVNSQQTTLSAGQTEVAIDIDHLPNGLYMVVVETASGKAYEKLLISK